MLPEEGLRMGPTVIGAPVGDERIIQDILGDKYDRPIMCDHVRYRI